MKAISLAYMSLSLENQQKMFYGFILIKWNENFMILFIGLVSSLPGSESMTLNKV